MMMKRIQDEGTKIWMHIMMRDEEQDEKQGEEDE